MDAVKNMFHVVMVLVINDHKYKTQNSKSQYFHQIKTRVNEIIYLITLTRIFIIGRNIWTPCYDVPT